MGVLPSGSKTREFCRQHAKEGMVDLTTKERGDDRGDHDTGTAYGVSPGQAKDGPSGSRAGSAGGGDSGSRRQSKRPRQPGDVPSTPAPVKAEVCETTSSARRSGSEPAPKRRRAPAGGDPTGEHGR
eukprot:g1626.t1